MNLPPKPTSEIRRVLRAAAPLFVSATVLAAGLAALYPFGGAGRSPEPAPLAAVAPAVAPRPFPSVELTAASAIVVDLNTGRALFERDADRPLPLASITKLVTALVASERLDPEAKVTVASVTETAEGPTFVLPPEPMLATDGTPILDEAGNPRFYEAQEVTQVVAHTVPIVAEVRDAIAYALVASSNEAAAALAAAGGGEETFVAEMNRRAAEVGGRTFRFANPTGLDEGGQASAVGSARDVAALLGYLVAERPSLVAPTAKKTVTIQTDQGPLTAKNTNEIVGTLPNLLGGKTGLETSAGGNLAVVVDPGLGQPIAIVVLGSTKEGRFADVQALADATVRHLSDDAPAAPSTGAAEPAAR
jgi:D-alanyl-D-alanine carboxypeptidase (penicillin-binding protein 5/6)